MRKIYPMFLGIAMIACTSNPDQNVNENMPPINEVFVRFNEQSLRLDPLAANLSGVQQGMDTLPNYLSENYSQSFMNHYQSFIEELNKYKPEELNRDERLEYDFLNWYCNSMIQQGRLFETMLPINQMSGLNIDMRIIGMGGNIQPFETVKDYENWLSRLEDYAVWLDQALINMQKGIKIGYKQPKEITEKIIPQWESFHSTTAEENVFFTPIKNMPDEISYEDSVSLANKFKIMIIDLLTPRYEGITEFLKNDYLNNPRPTAGISSIPYGKETYEQLLKYHTTTDLSPDSIFNLGMSEVSRIRGEISNVMEEVKFKGTYKEFLEHIRTNPDLKPFTEPQQVIENFYSIHERIKPKLNELFSIKPRTPFEVRRTEAFREASASPEYSAGNPDGSRPGIFYIPIPNVPDYNINKDEALFLHEAIPGHHLEKMLTIENKKIPDFRKSIRVTAFVEGWGLYCESLGKELGLYSDPYQYFGMLNMEMFRAIRLVVDVGLHYKSWTREEAIQFHVDNMGLGMVRFVERYMVWPGQATSYKIGQLTILALRNRAEEKLGDQFDIKEFHNQVLKDGPIPLTLLEKKIDNWIGESLETN